MEGTIKFYNSEKNFGFITSPEGKDYYYFIKEWRGEGQPQKGSNVTFDTKEGRKGEIAVNIKLAV